MSDQLVNTIGNYEPNNLFAGAVSNIVSEGITLKSGQAYLKGTVLGLIESEGKATIVDSSQTDGTERPYGILADNVDATEEDKVAVVYLTGEFNENALIFGGTDTAETHKTTLREMGIFLKKNR